MSTNPWQAPVIGQYTVGDSSVTVSWTFPPSEGAEQTEFFILYTNNGINQVIIQLNNGVSGIFTYTFNNLTNGTAYSFSIFAANENSSEYSNSQPLIINATPVGPPTGTTTVTATPSNGQVTLGWSTPSNDGGATISYILEYNTTG